MRSPGTLVIYFASYWPLRTSDFVPRPRSTLVAPALFSSIINDRALAVRSLGTVVVLGLGTIHLIAMQVAQAWACRQYLIKPWRTLSAPLGMFGDAGNDTIYLQHFFFAGAGATYDGGADFDTFTLFGSGASVLDVRDDTLGGFETIKFCNQFGGGAEVRMLAGQLVGISLVNADAHPAQTTTLGIKVDTATSLDLSGGNDIILGRNGNDTISSGAGNDPPGYEVISGGVGADSLTGGGGHDFFNYELITHGGDIITDFATGAGDEDDILDFRPMFPTFTGKVWNTVAQAVTSGHLTYTQAGANTQVFADADAGGNNNVLIATLLNTTAANVAVYTLI